MMKKWRIKKLLMAPFALAGRRGEDLYERLTARVLGTQQGMSRKWCYWFREHILLCRRYAGTDFGESRIWLFEPGWSLAPVILSRLISRKGILVSEDRRRLARRYLPHALEEVSRTARRIIKSAGSEKSGLGLLKDLKKEQNFSKILDICRAEYIVTDLKNLENIGTSSADVCFSMGRLEHYSEKELVFLLGQMKRILKPKGIASHIVDHRDHFWHFDKSIHCFHHLTFSDRKWSKISKGRHIYRNRLLEKDYLRLFQQSGFEILASIHELHRHDAEGVDPKFLWGSFSGLSSDDLQAAVSHFIVRCR
jgi:hypothetical protein